MEIEKERFMELFIKRGGMMKYLSIAILLTCLLIGCEQQPDDVDNAVVTGVIYQYATATDSVFSDSEWVYTDWEFANPVESVQVWVEGDPNSSLPYEGPDIEGYTDENGYFSIPVYLGEEPSEGSMTGYKYIEYADVRVFAVYKGNMFDFGGGVTLGRGKEFKLFPIALTWFLNPWGSY